ncbi:TonB-dependent receptor [Sphingomonas immobilis]|uniref:TonB-dependent receptor n=1 Tax=Sphingomonas immobilis TaxID=3063997 RepID=A0ABT8ZW69_9SPHN|nr:TonB-dependent receptor [Sphingomonas sp. CA1-15]MDO7841823.1 TonB-dependent receptor [Sphingomonas sp. CA1-15]
MIRTAIYLLSAAPLALSAQIAHAQSEPVSTPDTAAPAADEPVQSDIIVVGTAGGGTRRQDAAFAVTTLSSDAITRAAPTSTADILRTVPGVMAESSGGQNGANIFVRGYPAGGDAQFVTFQIAGVPIFPPSTLSFLENSQLIRLDETVERVEAVRGGTGSLFSAGQPGLTVNVVPRIGGKTLKGFAKFSITDYGDKRGDAWISGPLNQDTTFMVGGYYAQGHGIRNPGFDAEKGGQITANIHHDFDGRGSLEVYGRYLNDHGQWLLTMPVVQNGTQISQYPGFSGNSNSLIGPETQVVTNAAGRRIDISDGRGAKIFNAGITFDYEVADGLRVRERTAYLGGTANTNGLVPVAAPTTAAAMAVTLGGAGSTVGSLNYANGGGAVSTGASTQVLQAGAWNVQKKITSFVTDSALEWKTGGNTLTGGFYYANYTTHDNWALGNNVLLTATPNARLLSLTLGDGRVASSTTGTSGGQGFLVDGSYTGNDYAFYAVDELQITPELRVDGGIRWQRHEVTGQVRTPGGTVNVDGNANTLYDNVSNVLGTTPQVINYGAEAWSWTVGANYDFSRNLGVFARYSRGNSFPQFDNLRGLSDSAIAAHTGTAVTAKVDTYEGGVKYSSPLLNLYLTVFHNKFDGLATTQIVTLPGGGTGVVSSIGGAKATGVELEGVVRPVQWFSLTASGTYLDGTYQGYFTNNGLNNNTGNMVQRQPKWAWRVTPALDVNVGGLKPSLYATVQYTGDRFSDPENQQLLPHFYQVDAGVSVTIADRYTFQVTGNNLTNEFGLTEGNPRQIGSQGAGVVLARPILGRSFRFSAAVKF